MTATTTDVRLPGTGLPAGLAAVRAHLAPVLATVAERARERERTRELPAEEVRLLAAAGFGAVRLPVADGGAGLTVRELAELLVDLGRADANQPQLWRNHVAFVEDRLWHRDAPGAERWLARVAAGDVVGGAWSQKAPAPGEEAVATRVDDTADPATVTGTKYYSTGSIYADWITVTGKDTADRDVLVVVDAHDPRVALHDDWDGIGQRLTGSGTTLLDAVPVAPDGLYADGGRSPHQEIVFQLVLLTSLAGVAAAARDDATAAVRRRVRNYPQGLAAAPREDAIVQGVVGRVAAHAAAARAVVLAAADAIDAGLERLAADPAAADVRTDEAGRVPVTPEPLRDAAVATWEAQLVAADAALRAGTELFDALGSSAVERGTQFDRHWRNARTLTSHNPLPYKAALVGDWYLNGTDPFPWARRHAAP
ncbi:acyl-CoA dehydrogenase family protein [Cellulomonas sp. Sa3CUA2]|uniref:Acyl-CoA dehydrogenase family protein n=1 Tax=Cellulomonas avistercoris TaxID=2762242 RepID=A0ABR8QGN5_9CELL|nr:acyl-CoA dehydrogenase family protein [Cellulomonas avistercoris]MBD7919595.1 acyl-CoA dehydrogenase family protein [Cellulomonas avistercoris]